MSTVAEITNAIPQLTNEELRAVERRLLQEYRERKVGIVFDDAYGTLHDESARLCPDQPEPIPKGESILLVEYDEPTRCFLVERSPV